MPRQKTITDAEILAVARTLFLQVGAKASTRTLAKLAGISEAVIFQRFGTKENLFFAAMVPPTAQLETIFAVQIGAEQVTTNLQSICVQIVAYFREVMPIFLSSIAHPAFDLPTFLQRHTLPAMQISDRLCAYLNAEADLGRIRPGSAETMAAILISHLHHLALSETIGSHQSIDLVGGAYRNDNRAIADAIALLCRGVIP
jgi:AcrR family transcriptional regulator